MKHYLLISFIVSIMGNILWCSEVTSRGQWIREFLTSRDPDSVLHRGLQSRDSEIRGKAIYEYFQRHGEKALPELEKQISGAEYAPGMSLIYCASSLKDPAAKFKMLSAIARGAGNQEVIREANRLNFPFHRNNIRLSERKDHDFEIVKLQTIPLPEKDWRFMFDRSQTGHMSDFHKTTYSDKHWQTRSMGSWTGGRNTGWYRIRFTAPPRPDCNAAELHFTGVESAGWIWLNGIYIGARDEGQMAWDRPFHMDITSEIKWGTENLLVVRVSSSGMEGGIYKPIFLEILK